MDGEPIGGASPGMNSWASAPRKEEAVKKIEAYDSAYPGSMFEREDGGFVRRDDAESLAGSLLALIKSADRAAEDLQDALTQAKKDTELYAKKDQANYELREENKRLKDALFFWLPNIPAVENECTDRMANDAALLVGHEGRIDDSAEQRGWVVLTPNLQGQGREPQRGEASPAPQSSASGDKETSDGM